MKVKLGFVHLPGIDNILPDTLSRLYEIENPVNELEGDNARLLNRTAIKLPSINDGECITPADSEERKELLLKEHLKGYFGSDTIYHALKRYNPLRPITATLPGDSWGNDLAGPMKTSLIGNNYLLIMVDIATRYCILKPIPDKQSMTIVKTLIDVFSNYGFPRILQSDNGGEFTHI
ncbi:hypothetical protein G6F21_013371 [Rhizopus arrhizus]|nr:hypothetical protein G6F21_013371 [Rhizopus arrhizus]